MKLVSYFCPPRLVLAAPHQQRLLVWVTFVHIENLIGVIISFAFTALLSCLFQGVFADISVPLGSLPPVNASVEIKSLSYSQQVVGHCHDRVAT